jgi:hypothetical protein
MSTCGHVILLMSCFYGNTHKSTYVDLRTCNPSDVIFLWEDPQVDVYRLADLSSFSCHVSIGMICASRVPSTCGATGRLQHDVNLPGAIVNNRKSNRIDLRGVSDDGLWTFHCLTEVDGSWVMGSTRPMLITSILDLLCTLCDINRLDTHRQRCI